MHWPIQLTIDTIFGADDLLESVVGLSADLQSFCEGGCSGRQEHEFLESKFVSSMRPSVDDVEGRGRKDERGLDTSKVGEVLVERNSLFSSSRLGYGDRDTKNSVCAEFSLVRSSIKLNEEIIDVLLLRHFETGLDECRGNDIVHV